jgi:hypothetical protein
LAESGFERDMLVEEEGDHIRGPEGEEGDDEGRRATRGFEAVNRH